MFRIALNSVACTAVLLLLMALQPASVLVAYGDDDCGWSNFGCCGCEICCDDSDDNHQCGCNKGSTEVEGKLLEADGFPPPGFDFDNKDVELVWDLIADLFQTGSFDIYVYDPTLFHGIPSFLAVPRQDDAGEPADAMKFCVPDRDDGDWNGCIDPAITSPQNGTSYVHQDSWPVGTHSASASFNGQRCRTFDKYNKAK